MIYSPEDRERVIAILRENLPLTCGLHCEAEWTQAAEASAYSEAADAILEALSSPMERGGGDHGSSVAESGGTASPKSDGPSSAGGAFPWVRPDAKLFRHRKRGTLYALAFNGGEAIVQREEPIEDGDVLTVYVGEDGMIFARPTHEFYDGRFEPLGLVGVGADMGVVSDLLEALTELVLYHDVPAEAQDPIVKPLLRAAFTAIHKAQALIVAPSSPADHDAGQPSEASTAALATDDPNTSSIPHRGQGDE